MGCSCSTGREKSLSDTESLLKTYEDALGWGDFSATKIAVELEAAGKTDLKIAEMERFLVNMRVRVPDFVDRSQPLTNLYNRMRVKSRYSRSKLALMGVLLGHGSKESKCEVVEKFYTGIFGELDIVSFTQDVCDLALTHFPLYASMELQYARDAAAATKLGKYRTKLETAKNATVRFVLNRLMPDSQSLLMLGEMKLKLGDEGVQSVFSARRLRTLAVTLPKTDDAEPRVVSMLKTPYISPSVSPRHRRAARESTEEVIIN